MIEVTQDALRRVFPGARPEYLAAFDACKAEMDAAGVTASPLRWSHFLGQIGAETGGLKIIRENMSYSADRIMQVFGWKHSAKVVTRKEASRLAGNPQALAERVYGLGNPSMAKRLGNTADGDGYAYRGWGPGQITGKGKTLEYGKRMGLDLEAKPELLNDPAIGLKAMLMEWGEKDCNKFADLNQIGCISRAINLGNPYHKATPNGMEHRQAAFNKAWGLYRDAVPETEPHQLRMGDKGEDVKDLQESLAKLGYAPGFADGVFGPQTRRAVAAFQVDHSLGADGIVGKKTWAALREAKPIDWGDRALVSATTLLSRGSAQIATARKTQRRGLTLLGSSLGAGVLINSMPSSIDDIPASLQKVQALGDSLSQFVAWAMTPSGALSMGLVVAVYYGWSLLSSGKAVEAQRVEEARSGANLSK